MDLLIAPVWVPGIDHEIPKIIEFALRIGAGKKWPPLGIQKYVPHKRGRKPKGVKPMSWSEFWRMLRELERKHGVTLILDFKRDFGTHPRRMLPVPFKVGELIEVEVKGPGWLKGEILGVSGQRAVTLVGAPRLDEGARVIARAVQNKHNIIIAKFLREL